MSTALETQIAESLAKLGDDPETVAGRLSAAGVQGFRHSRHGCPVASYLRTQLGAVDSLSVTSTFVHVIRGSHLTTVSSPRPVRDFVRAFDNAERFSELVMSC
jgi:hypothetical protein